MTKKTSKNVKKNNQVLVKPKNYSKDDEKKIVVYLMLKTGIEIISEMKENKQDSVVLIEPNVMAPAYGDNGQFTIAMQPFISSAYTSENTFEITKDNFIVGPLSVKDGFKKYYLEFNKKRAEFIKTLEKRAKKTSNRDTGIPTPTVVPEDVGNVDDADAQEIYRSPKLPPKMLN